MSLDKYRTALADFISAETGGTAAVTMGGKLGGGAIQDNWAIDVEIAGGPQAGRHELVLRSDAVSRIAESRSRAEEVALLQTALDAGMTVPQPFALEPTGKVIGRPFSLIRRLPGVAEPRQVLHQLADLAEMHEAEHGDDKTSEAPGDVLARRLGEELAKLHRVTLEAVPGGLAFLEPAGPDLVARRVADYRRHLDQLPEPQPVLEWALNWIEDHAPAIERITLCHRDFRLGNLLIDDGRLTGVLDFEFAGWSDPDEDLGWLCARCWRFGAFAQEAGGIGSRAAFYDGYRNVAGREIDDRRIRFWEIFGTLRWAMIALDQGERHFSGGERSLNLALTTLRALECDYDLLHDIEAFDKPAPEKKHRHKSAGDEA
ncbi:phosphotransferase family protein [Dongia soli]|uniref:Phosphotransferase family protein n=1 Tax=Dongia soli TaxID=600628 RepID=A0ABU5EGW0_9PROT|nr:phosphotransferase family protein [Dongia soli]MDY0885670.1 phosphotransferase family protein [Dongia soli]